LASSTRYAMFASKPVEHLPRWLRASGLHITQASLDALNGLDAFQKLLVGFRILDDRGRRLSRAVAGRPRAESSEPDARS
jgi:hypothetical protein